MYLTIKQVADRFNVNESTVYRWFNKGLKKSRIGGTTRIDEKDLDEFIKKE